jgi:hypothetical protein
MLSTKIRPWACAVPQPGWGGTTLAAYVQEIERRPDANGNEDACKRVLDAMVASGHAQTVEPGEDGLERWELTDAGHNELIAPIGLDEGASIEDVLLELQPGVTASSATTDAEA